MTDIVERLRAYRSRIMTEAADEIERLRALGPEDDWEARGAAGAMQEEIERLRGLLAWHDSTVPEILADNTRLRAVLHQLVSEGKISPNIARELLGWVTIEASP